MKRIKASQAWASFSKLLTRVAAGEQFLITRHGKPVAQLIPPPAPHPSPNIATLIDRWIESRKPVTLGGLRIRDLINHRRR